MNASRIIGIVGASGSGKTTVANELGALAGNCCIISQDNYYRTLPSNIDAADWNFDDPSAIDLEHLASDLAALKRGETVKAPLYIFADHKRAPNTLTLRPAPVIIAEGLFLFTTEQLRSVFDLKIFIDVPSDVCLERRIARDVVERGRTATVVRQRWIEQVAPMFKRHVEPTQSAADIFLSPEALGTQERAKQIAQCLKQL